MTKRVQVTKHGNRRKVKEEPTTNLKVGIPIAHAIIGAAKNKGVTVEVLLSVALKSINNHCNTMLLDSRFRFGKYRGHTLDEIIRCDPSYVDWCLNHVDRFKISEDADKMLDLYLDRVETEIPF